MPLILTTIADAPIRDALGEWLAAVRAVEPTCRIEVLWADALTPPDPPFAPGQATTVVTPVEAIPALASALARGRGLARPHRLAVLRLAWLQWLVASVSPRANQAPPTGVAEPPAPVVWLDVGCPPRGPLRWAATRGAVVVSRVLVAGPQPDDAVAPTWNLEFAALTPGPLTEAVLAYWQARQAIGEYDQRSLDQLAWIGPAVTVLEPDDPDRHWGAVCPPQRLGEMPPCGGLSAGRDRQGPSMEPVWPPTSAAHRPWGVNLVGYFESEKGLGQAMRATVAALDAAAIPASLINWVDPSSANTEQPWPDRPFTTEHPYAVSIIEAGLDQVLLTAVPRLGLEWTTGHWVIGYGHWEMTDVPADWAAEGFAYYDEVWAPSRFTVAALQPRCPVPVRCVPLVVTVPPEIQIQHRRDWGVPPQGRLLLTAFDFQSTLARKNPLGAIAAFRKAFGNRADVTLLIKTVHAADRPSEAAVINQAIRGATNIVWRDGLITRPQMAGLIAMADAYVALHRAEGYGLPIAEAMAQGKPVIATGWSGNMDFMTPDNSLPVASELVRLQTTTGPYPAGGQWAEPDLADAAAQMTRLVNDAPWAERLGRQAAADIAAKLSPVAVGRIMASRLAALTAVLPLPERTNGANLSGQLLGRLRAVSDPSRADLGSHRHPLIGRPLAYVRKQLAGLLAPLFARQAKANAATADALADLQRRDQCLHRELLRMRAELAGLRGQLQRSASPPGLPQFRD